MSASPVESPHLAPIARTTLAAEITKRLFNFIVEEGLRPGDKLPSERDLIARLGVSRSSLREALKTLAAVGVVETAVGEGIYVGRGDTSVLAKPLSWVLLMAESSARELIQARRVVEAELAALAAEQASEEEIAAIGEKLAAMRAHWDDPEGYSRSDLEFHLAIARGAHNGVLYHVLTTLGHIVRVWILENYSSDPSDRIQAYEEHQPVHEAIQAHDVAAARAAMARHLDAAGGRLLRLVSHTPERRRGQVTGFTWT